MISKTARDRVQGLIEDAADKGAELQQFASTPDEGYFLAPTLVLNTSDEMRLYSEEIFGPIAGLQAFDEESEVISAANNTRYGLAAYCYTENHGRMWRLGENLDYGMVGINETVFSNAAAPFGGVKESGHGREGSKYGIEDYLDIRQLSIGL